MFYWQFTQFAKRLFIFITLGPPSSYQKARTHSRYYTDLLFFCREMAHSPVLFVYALGCK